jgi:hypothetical protein
MNRPLLPAFALTLLLTQCVDPYYYGPNGPGGYGPNGGGPYPSPYRQDLREQGSQLGRQAYERGLQEGTNDAQARQSQNYNRHRSSFDHNTEMAFRDGYNQGYSQASSRLGGLQGPNSGYPPNAGGYGTVPPPSQPPENDPAYNQGYDYGLRDLTGGRQPDPAAHVGRYDPRHRSSFERGYYDGYNSRSNQGTQGGAGGLWFR